MNARPHPSPLPQERERDSRRSSSRLSLRVYSVNPKGSPSSSPGLPSPRGYPGRDSKICSNPNGVVSPLRRRRNPVGVESLFSSLTQGSSPLATLGFAPESRWDSFPRHATAYSLTSCPQPRFPDKDPADSERPQITFSIRGRSESVGISHPH